MEYLASYLSCLLITRVFSSNSRFNLQTVMLSLILRYIIPSKLSSPLLLWNCSFSIAYYWFFKFLFKELYYVVNNKKCLAPGLMSSYSDSPYCFKCTSNGSNEFYYRLGLWGSWVFSMITTDIWTYQMLQWG